MRISLEHKKQTFKNLSFLDIMPRGGGMRSYLSPLQSPLPSPGGHPCGGHPGLLGEQVGLLLSLPAPYPNNPFQLCEAPSSL